MENNKNMNVVATEEARGKGVKFSRIRRITGVRHVLN